jgi:hypothetical protein
MHQERASLSGATPTEPTIGHGGRRSSSGQDAASESKMRIIEILDHLSPAVRREVESFVKYLEPAKMIAPIVWRHAELLRFAPKEVWRYKQRRGFFLEAIDDWTQAQCVAEMIVVAIRLQRANRRTEWNLCDPGTPLHSAALKIQPDELPPRSGVRILLAFIFDQPSSLPLTELKLTSDGILLGAPQAEIGRDIANVDRLTPYVRLCTLQIAIKGICRAADDFGWTAAERAAVLNQLPRWECEVSVRSSATMQAGRRCQSMGAYDIDEHGVESPQAGGAGARAGGGAAPRGVAG